MTIVRPKTDSVNSIRDTLQLDYYPTSSESKDYDSIYFERGDEMLCDSDYYLVKAGVMVSETFGEDTPTYLRWHIPGDVINVNQLMGYRERMLASTVALVIVLPRQKCIVGELKDMMFKISRAVAEKDMKYRLITQGRSVEQRVVGFLLKWSGQMARRRLNPDDFLIPLSRRQVAEYLDIASESCSREFHLLEEKGLIKLSGTRNQCVSIIKRKEMEDILRGDRK